MGNSATFVKDSNAVLDYQIDWSDWLGSDTISNSSWIVEDGITVSSSTNTTTTATIWLSSGSIGCNYNCINRIETAGGRTEDQTITIVIISK